jgi:hypothetical protein
VASVIGFITLIIAHHLALEGDTMEMMRAVLDTNFWLATARRRRDRSATPAPSSPDSSALDLHLARRVHATRWTRPPANRWRG